MVGNTDPKVKLSRRSMLAAGGLVLAAAGIYAVFGTDSGDANSDAKGGKAKKAKPKKLSKASRAKVDALLENYPYLKINRADAEKYVRDFERYTPAKSNKLGDKFYTTFLLSTDFFLQGAKTENPLNYLAFYNPARVPCQHPFARFD